MAPDSVGSSAVALDGSSEAFNSPASECQHSILFSGLSSTVIPRELRAAKRVPSGRKVRPDTVSTSSSAAGESCSTARSGPSSSNLPSSSAAAHTPSGEHARCVTCPISACAASLPSSDMATSRPEPSAATTPNDDEASASHPDLSGCSHRGWSWNARTPSMLLPVISEPLRLATPTARLPRATEPVTTPSHP